MSVNAHHANKTPRLCPQCGSTTLRGRARELLRSQREQRRVRFLELWGELSEREREVVLLIATGVMPAQISETLGISSKTVSTYRTRALEKLQMDGTAEIAVAAYAAGLLE